LAQIYTDFFGVTKMTESRGVEVQVATLASAGQGTRENSQRIEQPKSSACEKDFVGDATFVGTENLRQSVPICG
jgi:hypothetical protein